MQEDGCEMNSAENGCFQKVSAFAGACEVSCYVDPVVNVLFGSIARKR